MHRTRPLRAIGVLACVGLFGAVGCATNPAEAYKKTAPATIASDAHAALKATTGIHVAGTVQLGNESLTVDLMSDTTGAVIGTATIAGVSAQVLGTGGKNGRVYIKGGTDFWGNVAPHYATTLANKWALNVDPMPLVIAQLTLPKLIQNEAKYAWDKERPVLAGTGTVNGISTVQISVTDTFSGAKETLDVSATDPHHVLRESEGSDFTLIFDRFGATVTAPAPAPADVVDLLKIVAAK